MDSIMYLVSSQSLLLSAEWAEQIKTGRDKRIDKDVGKFFDMVFSYFLHNF